MKGLAEAFENFNKLLKKFENMDLKFEKFSLKKRHVEVYYLLTSKFMTKKKKSANHHGYISERVTPPQKEPQGDPSKDVSKE